MMIISTKHSDFDKITLSKNEIKILKLLQKQDIIATPSAEQALEALRQRGFIERQKLQNSDSNWVARINALGKDYISFAQGVKRKNRIESRKYWITTAIAILALVLSGIALANQVGLLQFPKSLYSK